MIRLVALTVATLFGLVSFAAAQTPCQPTALEVQGARIFVSYDPFLNNDALGPVSLDIQAGDCASNGINFDIISADQPLTSGTRGYELAPRFRIDFVDQQGRSFSSFSLPGERARPRAGARAPLSDVFRVLVRRGQAVPPGMYDGRFILRSLDENGVVQSERPFTLVVEALASVRVGSPTRIVDFGTLEAGESARLHMNTFSNVAYEVRVESERGWHLRNEEAATGGVPYSVWLQNQRLGGGGPNAAVAIEPRGASGFSPLDLGIRIEPFTTQPAGLYRDYLTIQVTPIS